MTSGSLAKSSMERQGCGTTISGASIRLPKGSEPDRPTHHNLLARHIRLCDSRDAAISAACEFVRIAMLPPRIPLDQIQFVCLKGNLSQHSHSAEPDVPKQRSNAMRGCRNTVPPSAGSLTTVLLAVHPSS